MKIELGHGTVIETATQEDIDFVEENFREGERAEHEVFGGKRTRLSDFETCWTVRHKGDVIGYFGIAIPLEATVHHSGRWLCYMSCANADKYKFMYVKQSREVMRKVIEGLPEHITEFRSMPAERYAMSVKWHERVLRMHRMKTVELNGERFVVFGISRKEAVA